MVITTQPRIRVHWSPTGRTEVTQNYYRVRACDGDDKDYWEASIDPDGVTRNRLTEAERLQWQADNHELIEAINGMAPQSVLDFGAGPGWLLGAINASLKVAVETSPKCLELLLRPDSGIDMASESLADYASDSQDLVIANHIFEHLVDPVYHLMHLRRVLKPRGVLILGTPDFGCPCAKRFGPNFRMLHDPTHRSLFTLESCSRMLRDYAFEILDVQFPFPERYATSETFLRWNDTSQVSPPWPGNWMTFFVRR